MKMEDKQGELQRISSEVEVLRNQIDVHNRNLELLQTSIDEMNQTVESLEELKKTEPGKEMLVPMGSGSYVRASLKQNDKVIIGVGSDFSIERRIDQAKAIVDKRVQRTEEASNKTRENLEELSQRLEDLTSKWQEIYRELSQQQEE